MKLLRRHSSKNTDHVEFLFFVERLTPWPTLHGSIAVQWQRGGRRKGQTKPSWPDNEDPASFATYAFGETLIIPASLYHTDSGGFEDKMLQVFVAQVDDRGKELNVLGGLDLNLSDFANIQGRVRQEFPVECSSTIWGAAGGRPLLTLTIGVARGGGERTADLAAAMSDLATVDEVPSTLSTNDDGGDSAGKGAVGSGVSSRGDAFDPGPSGLGSGLHVVREEDGGHSTDAAASVAGPPPSRVPARAAQSGGGGPLAPDSHTRSPQYDSDGFLIESDAGTTGVSGRDLEEYDSEATSGVVKRSLTFPDVDPTHPSNCAKNGGGAEADRPGGHLVQALDVSPQPAKPTHARRFSRDGAVLGSRKWAWRRHSNDPSEGQNTEYDKKDGEGRGEVSASGVSADVSESFAKASAMSKDQIPSLGPLGSTPDARALGLPRRLSAGGGASFEDRLTRELQLTAALESAVYLAGSGWSRAAGRSPLTMDALQAPARRLARTIIILGEDEGTAFALRAIAAIRVAGSASLGDSHRLLLWWANLVTLRWSLWTLGGGRSGGVPKDGSSAHRTFSWMDQSVAPALRQLEESIFNDLVEYLWASVLLRVTKETADAACEQGRRASVTAANGDPLYEGGAVSYWISGLTAVDRELICVGRPPPAPRALHSLARRQALQHILMRLDTVLFSNLLSDGGGVGGGSASRGANNPGTCLESLLDPALLPFQRGPTLNFGTGVDLKMAAGKLANWAADAGVREAPPLLHGGSGAVHNEVPPPPASGVGVRLFAQLRAGADLLMMPKGELSNAEVRLVVAPSLSVGAVCKILQRYKPDDPASESFSPALLKQLRKEEAAAERSSGGSKGAGTAGLQGGTGFVQGYEAPDEVELLEEGLIEPLSLEVSGDSDDELSALEERSVGDCRFQLLRELWKGVRTSK